MGLIILISLIRALSGPYQGQPSHFLVKPFNWCWSKSFFFTIPLEVHRWHRSGLGGRGRCFESSRIGERSPPRCKGTWRTRMDSRDHVQRTWCFCEKSMGHRPGIGIIDLSFQTTMADSGNRLPCWSSYLGSCVWSSKHPWLVGLEVCSGAMAKRFLGESDLLSAIEKCPFFDSLVLPCANHFFNSKSLKAKACQTRVQANT